MILLLGQVCPWLLLVRGDGEQALAGTVVPRPFDLTQSDFDIKGIQVVLVFVEHKVLVEGLCILKLVAALDC
jgi:hypothetical protein